MTYFPLFITLENRDVLVVGAGKVAERKVEKLLPFNPRITVVAREVKSKFIENLYKNGKINLINRSFLFTDLDGKDLVIVAVDDINLQREIYNYCYRRKIPVNSVDSPQYCTFLFPAYIKKEDIVIGISTSGKVPILAKKLKEVIESCLPNNISEIFNLLFEKRKSLKKGKEREQKLKELIDKLFQD